MTTNLQQEIAAINQIGITNIYGGRIAVSSHNTEMFFMQQHEGLLMCSIDMYSIKGDFVEFDVDAWEAEFIHLFAIPSKDAAYALSKIARVTNKEKALPSDMPYVVAVNQGVTL
mgnify:CR=1 FL=1